MARKHFYCQKRVKINVTSDFYLLNVNSPNSVQIDEEFLYGVQYP